MSTRTHLRNLAANWGSNLATLAVMFFLSPFVVHTLGQEEYGVWSLLTVLTGYMGVLDLGVRASTGRYIIFYLSREDHASLDRIVRTTLGFFSGLGIVVVAAGACLGWVFPSVFQSVPREYHTLVQLLLPLLALNVWLSAIQAVFSSVLIAHERFDLARGVDLAGVAVQAVGTVLALSQGFGLLGLAAVTILCHVLGVAGNYLLARRLYPALRVWPLLLARSSLRELLGYGLGAFVTAISIRIIGQTDMVVAGATLGVASVTVYSIGATLVYYSQSVLAVINQTLFPTIQKAVAREEAGETRRLFLRTGQLGLVCGLLVYVGLMTFSEPFIRLWMYGPEFGEDSVHQAALVMSLLAAAKLPFLFVGASVPVLNAQGRVRLTASLAIGEAVANLGLSLLFVIAFGWGLSGIALGTLAARLMVGTFFAPWCACTATGTNWRTYVWRLGGTGALACMLLAAISLAVQRILPGGTWLWFFLQVAVVSTVYMVLAYCLLIPSEDRQRLRRAAFPARPAQETG